jgi:hypothetical protein
METKNCEAADHSARVETAPKKGLPKAGQKLQAEWGQKEFLLASLRERHVTRYIKCIQVPSGENSLPLLLINDKRAYRVHVRGDATNINNCFRFTSVKFSTGVESGSKNSSCQTPA